MKSTSKNSSVVNRILSMAMLLLYVAAFFITPSFEHHHHEAESAQHCSADNEVDSCHRVIVHNEIKQGCEHDEHISKFYYSCDVCDKLLTVYPKLIIDLHNIIKVQSSEVYYAFYTENLLSQNVLQSSARAPPILA